MLNEVISMTSVARRKGLASQFDEAHAMIDEAEVLAGHDPVGRAWCAIERGRLFNSAGDVAKALPFFARSWTLAKAAGEHDLAVDALHMLAIATPLDEAARWTEVALDYIADHPQTVHWKGPLFNNIGWHYFEVKRFEEALQAFREGVKIRESGGAQELRIANYAVIRTLRALGRIDEAIERGERVVATADAAGDTAPFVYEELAECYGDSDTELSQHFAERALVVLADNQHFMNGEPERVARLRCLAAQNSDVMK